MQLAFTMRGASGTELRYQNYDTALADSAGTAYTFDPQGSAVQPVTLYLPGTFPNVKVRSSSSFDGFGLLQAAATADTSDAFDPFGFGGQAGYYRDYTGLYLLTHRYYDAVAGRFVTRDPIGYKGGINLYGFVGNNPVNGSDPQGYAGGGREDSKPGGNPFVSEELQEDYEAAGRYGEMREEEEAEARRGSTGRALALRGFSRRVVIDFLQALKRHRMSPTSYPNPDPPMSEPPVRYEPQSIEEVVRMRSGNTPKGRANGSSAIEAHHRQQIPLRRGGVIDELTRGEHREGGNHTRHRGASQMTPTERDREISQHYRRRGGEYTLPGEGI